MKLNNLDAVHLLFGSVIESIDFKFKENIIKFEFSIESYKTKTYYDVIFYGVSKCKLEKDFYDGIWEVISLDDVYYIPEEKDDLILSDEEKRNYNFFIDGDAFRLLIKAEDAEIIETKTVEKREE